MFYCSLDEAFGDFLLPNDTVEITTSPLKETPYTSLYDNDIGCSDMREHCTRCPECSAFFSRLHKTEEIKEGFQEQKKKNIFLLLLILFILWILTKK